MEGLYAELERYNLSVFGPQELLEFRLACHRQGLPTSPSNPKWLNSMHTPDVPYVITTFVAKWSVPQHVLCTIFKRLPKLVLIECILVCRQFYCLAYPILKAAVGKSEMLSISYQAVTGDPWYLLKSRLVAGGVPTVACLRDVLAFERRKHQAKLLEQKFINSRVRARLQLLNEESNKRGWQCVMMPNGNIEQLKLFKNASLTKTKRTLPFAQAVQAYLYMQSSYSAEQLVADYLT